MPSSYDVVQQRKRKLETEQEPSAAELPAKRPKREQDRRDQTPSWFWDNLSRQWLTRRTLREFDRRTSLRVHPKSLQPVELTAPRLRGLKRFARQGGPDLRDIRAYPEPQSTPPQIFNMSSSQSRSSRRSSSHQSSRKRSRSSGTSMTRGSTWKSSAYDPGFEQHLADEGVLMHNRKQKPNNHEDIMNALQRPRPSLSPSRFSDDHFENFQEKNDEAKTESTVMNKVFPLIIGDKDIPSEANLPFKNLAHLTDGSITKAQPDHFDGVRPADLNARVRDRLNSTVVPSTNTSAPCLPNFFAEGKGPKGHIDVAKRQACYNGALGARAMKSLRTYADPDTALDGNAYTITSTYSGGSGGGLLTLYTTHVSPSSDPSRDWEYHMTQLNGWYMTGNINAFREGATALRNARDWAREHRKKLISLANETAPPVASSTSGTPASTSHSTHGQEEDSDTSPDELAGEASVLTSFNSDLSSIAPHHRPGKAAHRGKKVLKR